MSILEPSDLEKTLEIYEYYDMPLSSLVKFKNGEKALVEVRNLSYKTNEKSEIVIVLDENDIIKLKNGNVLLKNFILNKSKKNQVILWSYKENKNKSSLLSLEDTKKILKDMKDDLLFIDTSSDWNDYL